MLKEYEIYGSTEQPSPTFDNNRTIVNLSNYQLNSEEVSVLAKGGNFTVAPSRVPGKNIIDSTETNRAPPRKVGGKHPENYSVPSAKPPKSNIRHEERMALRNLNNNKSIVTLASDKGNATVASDVSDYTQKIPNLLDPATYKKLFCGPTSKILWKNQRPDHGFHHTSG